MPALEGFGRDLRFAGRSLRRRPGFAAAAIATLALGIGASTAIFSVAYGIALRPLPYKDPDRLVRIYEVNPAESAGAHNVAAPTFHAWRTEARSIESAALYSTVRTIPLANAPDSPPLRTMAVSPAFFAVLGARPVFGSRFPVESSYTRFTARDIVLSYGAWRRLFDGRTDFAGMFVETAKSGRFHVLGVMPEGFMFDEPVDGWMPSIVELPIAGILRGWRYDRVVARLKPGVTVAQATHDVAAVSAGLGHDYPKTNAGWTASVETLRSAVAGSFGRATGFLLATVAVVLLVACFNVGGLLMARAVARERETMIRVSLGAGGAQLLRLWLAEATMIGVTGAAAGVLLAALGVSALKAAAPPSVPRLDAIRIDGPTLLVALAALVAAIGTFTVVLAGRASIRSARERGGAGPASVGDEPRRTRLRTGLLVAQCAGAAMLVMLAVMLARSFSRLLASDLGWQPDHVVSFTVAPPVPGRRPWFNYVLWSDALVAGLRKTPGIRDAAITTQVPLSGAVYTDTVAAGRGKPEDDGRRWPATWHNVTDDYFDVMNVRLVQGRGFDARDRFTESQMTADSDATRPTEGVAIVTKSVERALWPGQSAIGQYVWEPSLQDIGLQVIGVVNDMEVRAVGEEPALHVFLPWTEFATGAPKLVVRTDGNAETMVPAIRAMLQSVMPGTRVDRIATLDDLVRQATAQPRFTSRLVALFGVAALLLAAVGIYGTQWYLVGMRTRELGLRLALGASRRRIVSSVVWAGLAPAIAGGVIGLGLAVALGRIFGALFFGLAHTDVLSLVAGGVCLMGAAAGAALGPGLRAARVDPMIALRAD